MLIRLILFIILTFSSITVPQSFGFGCFGLVGAFGGYSYQLYQPTGLNEYITVFNELREDSLQSPMDEFGRLKGYRVGLNLFRANLEGFILTAKGYYQYLSEQNDASSHSGEGEAAIFNYKFELKSWAVGIDLGTSITKSLSWKVIDAALLFNKGRLTKVSNYPGLPTGLQLFENEKSTLGYTVGTGFIFSIIDRYVSIEGSAGYTVLSIDQVQTSEGIYFPKNETTGDPSENFIESFGFNAVIQLNIGIPL
jgi:hypothetical protein